MHILNVMADGISIVIPARNDPLLPRAIASTPADIEVIVALTDPPQSTIDLVRSLMPGRNLRLEISPRRGMAVGVNNGTAAASHQKIIILDSDCRMLPGTIESYSMALDNYAYVRGITRVEWNDGWSRMAAKGTERLNRVFQAKPRLLGPSIAYRKDEFLSQGGYDEAMVRGSCDQEFALRLELQGIPIGFAPAAVLVHQPLSFSIDTRSHIGYGHGMRYIDRKMGGRYGLFYCLKRLEPRELLIRLVERGPYSVLRSLLLGSLMLWGYYRAGRLSAHRGTGNA